MTLKHTPCDCDEWRRLNEACADLLRERDELKDMVAVLKNRCENQDTYLIPSLEQKRDEWKQRAEDIYSELKDKVASEAGPFAYDIEELYPIFTGWFNNA